MRALMFVGPRRLEWHDARTPQIRGHLEAIVRPIASTTCDLDRRILSGRSPFEPPFAIGHECVGEVTDIGDKVRGVRPGDLVVVPWHISCGVCPACRSGMPNQCTTLPGLTGYGVPIGGDWGGLFSEMIRVPFADGMLTKLPAGVNPVAVASASDNLTDAYIGVMRGLTTHPGAPVLILGGLESLGLFAVDHALALGASSVDYVDAHEGRREAARDLGATPHGEMPSNFERRFPVVIGASRLPSDLKLAVQSMAPGGHLSILAMFFGDTPMPLWDMYLRDVSVSVGLPAVGAHVGKVLELAKCGHIHPERLMSVHPWEEAPAALLEPDIKPVIVRDRLLA